MTLRHIALFGALASMAALGAALASEHFLGLVPCALCYVERWPYRAGIAFGLAGMVLPGRWARAAIGLLLAAYLASAAAALVHVGVEQHWWKSPLPQCTAPDLTGLNNAERFARMPDRPAKSCEDADYPIRGVPLTMAQANLLFALAAAAVIAMSLTRVRRRA